MNYMVKGDAAVRDGLRGAEKAESDFDDSSNKSDTLVKAS